MGKRKGSQITSLFCSSRKNSPINPRFRPNRVLSAREMEGLWTSLSQQLDISDAIAEKWLERILASYSQPDRFYHHLDPMFLVHKLPHLKDIPKDSAVALASIFQYLEYRPTTDQSAENCALFRDFAADAGLSENQGALVSTVLGLLGAQPESGQVSEDLFNYFQDLDLAVLGSSEPEYAKYRVLLRKEFSELNDAAYNAMRLKVLQSLLQIPTIYSSEAFAHLEFTARANIEQEIAELSVFL